MWATSADGHAGGVATSKAEAGAQLSEGREPLELLVGDGDAQALLQFGLQLHAGEAIEMQVAVEAGIVVELCRLGASDGCDESGQRIGRGGGATGSRLVLPCAGDATARIVPALDFSDGGARKVQLRP